MFDPTITIITSALNSESYLEQTITSVINQTYQNKEYVIIDGGSTDSTIEIIRKYEDKIDYWTSEPDEGIADAMNKGIQVAKGDYIFFLHSDDYLIAEDVLEKASIYLDQSNDIFLFNIYYSKNGKKFLMKPRGFNWWMNIKTGVWHQSTICSSKLFKKIGYFDSQFTIPMDYDFFLRAYRSKVKANTINFPLAVMRDTGISSKRDWKSLKTRFSEEKRVHFKNSSNILMKLQYSLFWFFYIQYRRLLYLLTNQNN